MRRVVAGNLTQHTLITQITSDPAEGILPSRDACVCTNGTIVATASFFLALAVVLPLAQIFYLHSKFVYLPPPIYPLLHTSAHKNGLKYRITVSYL